VSLPGGTRVGPYEIVSQLGVGGMGEVYRARDPRLNRDVAIKALPELFAQDAERVARFTREAQTLAALNHPNIAQIYGIESAASGSLAAALVMELVEGEELSTIIARGPVPIAEALAIAHQIADALEAAHEQGIVHRDLKPANVKVRADGTVKVLDFGLAKAFDPMAASGSTSGSPSNSPTLTARATQMGMIIGTAAYMAPEQARGKAVDRRADVWAFGVVLYEMLTGRRAFEGEEISDVLAAVLRQDIDLSSLPATTPASVRRLLKRCLERDPRKRLSAIGDARLDIDEPDAAPATPLSPAIMSAPTAAPPSLVARLWPALAGAAITAIAASVMWPQAAPAPVTDARLARLSILPPPGTEMYPDSTGVTISPDGSMVAFLVGSVTQGEEVELWVRSLDTMAAKKLDDARGATLPFWSPDSRRIGYSASGVGKLKTIAATGGRAEVVVDSPTTRGAVWTTSNQILYAQPSSPILMVPASGGTPQEVTALDTARGERGHRFPSMLPDGDHFLYAVLPGKNGRFEIYAGRLSDPTHKERVSIGPMDAAPVYAEPGYLLYARQGVLAAVPFDATTLKITGDPILLEDEPATVMDASLSYTAGRSVSVSDAGSLAYYAAPSLNTVLTWFDASGAMLGTVAAPSGHYDTVSISPDGTRAAAVRSASASSASVWLVELARGTATPLSRGAGRNDSPIWSPDGQRVIFTSDRSGLQQFFARGISDTTPEVELFTSEHLFKNPVSFSRDGSSIVINVLESPTAQDIMVIDSSGRSPARTLVQNTLRDVGGVVSPDGKWLAYGSEVGGNLEVWVQAFPNGGQRTQISQQGGVLSWWTADGRQLIWTGSDLRSLWRAEVIPGPAFAVKAPVKTATLPAGSLWIDATPDRQRFLAVMPERTGTGSVTVVQNWRKALEKK
jgi:serine/threonine protein kinase/Tol biopolymer transport system component